MRNTTLCYVEANDHYLMLHRNKKEVDENKNKWIGVGGKFLEGESPEECLCREVLEETGLVLTNYRFRGLVTFISDQWGTEYMHLFTADGFYPEGEEEAYYAAVRAYEEEQEKLNGEEAVERPRYSKDIVAAREAADTAEIVDRIVSNIIEKNSEVEDAAEVAGEEKASEAEASEAEVSEAVASEAEASEAVYSLSNVKLKECPEGELRWVHKEDLFRLNLWEGDHKFLKLLIEEAPFFTMILLYQGDDLVDCDTHIYG